MKKLKKKVITKYLQKVRLPAGLSLKEFNTFYSKLTSKFGESKDIRLIERSGYYNHGGYWLIERRLETNEELAKRQKVLNARLAKRAALNAKFKEQRKIETARRRAAQKAHQQAVKKAQMERKVEEIKTMVAVLKAAGFEVSKTAVQVASRS